MQLVKDASINKEINWQYSEGDTNIPRALQALFHNSKEHTLQLKHKEKLQ